MRVSETTVTHYPDKTVTEIVIRNDKGEFVCKAILNEKPNSDLSKKFINVIAIMVK